ncbi:MAG: alpha/beta hydrolase [Bacteroidota bacterium]
MLKDLEIERWRRKGTYFRSTKAGRISVFVQELGNSAASPDQTLLLLHGFPESSFSFHRVLDGLLDGFERVILFDFPGYGLSDKPQTGYSYSLLEQADVALQVWKSFGVSGGHLLAHDMGDSVATELIAREVEGALPDWFSAGFQSYTITNGSIVLELAQLRIIQKLLLTRLGSTVSKLSSSRVFHHQIRSAHGEAPLDGLEVSRLWKMNVHNDGRKVTHLTIKYLLDRKRYEASRWLPAMNKTKVPIHLCWGDKDQVAKVEIAHYLKQQICPQAQLTIMEGAGHFCQLGSPEKWLRSILAFYTALRTP